MQSLGIRKHHNDAINKSQSGPSFTTLSYRYAREVSYLGLTMRQTSEDNHELIRPFRSRHCEETNRDQKTTKRKRHRRNSFDAKDVDAKEEEQVHRRRMKNSAGESLQGEFLQSTGSFTGAIALAHAAAPSSHRDARIEEASLEAFIGTLIVVRSTLGQTQMTKDPEEIMKFVEFSITALEQVIEDFGTIMTKRIR